MAKAKQSEREKKLKGATEILRALGFAPKQSNEVAGYTRWTLMRQCCLRLKSLILP